MADDETIFDPTLKKKKKKKKTGFNLEAALADGSVGDQTAPPVVEENGEDAAPKIEITDADDADMFGKKKRKKKSFILDELNDTLNEAPKEAPSSVPNSTSVPEDDGNEADMFGKKKKKKKPFNLNDLNDALSDIQKDTSVSYSAPPIANEVTEETNGTAAVLPTGMDFDFDMDFSKHKKKKKKGKKADLDDLIGQEGTVEEKENEGIDIWTDTDRDYTYDELLQRAFSQLRERNPDIVAGEKKKVIIKPPQVLKAGSKKTAFANFLDICRLLHRETKHLLQFLMAELGTSGSIDGNNQLVIKGRFQQKQIENVLKRYIKEYVTCHTCRSIETILQKDARLYFLQCEQCNSRCSVAPIKSGFQLLVEGKIYEHVPLLFELIRLCIMLNVSSCNIHFLF